MGCPCQDCPHRKLTCHDHCGEYADWHDALVAAKEAVRLSEEVVGLFADHYRRTKDWWRRRERK